MLLWLVFLLISVLRKLAKAYYDSLSPSLNLARSASPMRTDFWTDPAYLSLLLPLVVPFAVFLPCVDLRVRAHCSFWWHCGIVAAPFAMEHA